MREVTISSREKDVLTHLSAGKQNKEIARALGLSPETVKKSVARLLLKLRAVNRTEAAACAVRDGLV